MAEGSPSPAQRLALCALAFRRCPEPEYRILSSGGMAEAILRTRCRPSGRSIRRMSFCSVMGTDMLMSFEEWYMFRYLLDNCVLAVLSREEDDGEALRRQAERFERDYGAKVILLPHAPLPMSSSDIRQKLRIPPWGGHAGRRSVLRYY